MDTLFLRIHRNPIPFERNCSMFYVYGTSFSMTLDCHRFKVGKIPFVLVCLGAGVMFVPILLTHSVYYEKTKLFIYHSFVFPTHNNPCFSLNSPCHWFILCPCRKPKIKSLWVTLSYKHPVDPFKLMTDQ